MGTPNPAEAKIDIKISAADTVSHAVPGTCHTKI